jgi:hypothetical protein
MSKLSNKTAKNNTMFTSNEYYKELDSIVLKLKRSKNFLKITKISKSVHFTTKRMLQLNERIKECQDNINLIANK